ncbi:hypothetical protein AVEN_199153-1 [Araneus ventricosus]|uniref:Zinc finger PHD-type domain-containing protein n=1 Tax=Araneus ventricosus TaxID=182803 RepID=A0A4Y2K027_ARAVE|nr:hypothetical protein AVEN_199153-1 [Araneus ventricosus]
MEVKMELNSEEEKKERGEETHCIICAETFEEDWIQCRICEGWAHENCADLEGNTCLKRDLGQSQLWNWMFAVSKPDLGGERGVASSKITVFVPKQSSSSFKMGL